MTSSPPDLDTPPPAASSLAGSVLRGLLLLIAAAMLSYLLILVLAGVFIDSMYWLGLPTACLLNLVALPPALLVWRSRLKTVSGRRVFGWTVIVVIALSMFAQFFG